MTDAEYRWTELEFYFFCLDIYKYRKDMLDVTYVIEMVGAISSEFSQLRLKRIVSKLFAHPRVVPTRQEYVCLARDCGNLSFKTIGEELNITYRHAARIYHKWKDTLSFYPILDKTEIDEILKFYIPFEYIKKAGSHNVVDVR